MTMRLVIAARVKPSSMVAWIEKKIYCFANGCPRRVSEARNFIFTQNFNNNNTKNKVPIANEGLNMDMIILIRHLIA